MTVEKIGHSGAWKITGVLEGESDHHFLTRVYYGYTKRQAIRLWREQVREVANQ
jgi:hypothetical protein